jgi:hypothetical protein
MFAAIRNHFRFVLAVETSSFLYRGKSEKTQDWSLRLGLPSLAKALFEIPISEFQSVIRCVDPILQM